MGRLLAIGLGAALLGAAVSLLAPFDPVFDPWGWLVWGRELAHLDLATGAGPSWKPLPVLIDAPLSVLGGGAPQAWLLIARAGYLAAPLLAAVLVARLAAGSGAWRWAGAGLAAASVALGADAFTPPLRQFTGGLSEPLLVSLVLGAVLLALGGRTRGALWLGVAAALLRPECWPFLVLWGWSEVRRRPDLRPDALAAALLVPLAWFLPDLVAAGNPLEGSETARQGGFELDEVRQVTGRALAAPLAGAWVGAALFVALRRGELDRAATALLLGACAWVALVAAMAVAGFAGLPRFLAPASAVFAVVGGVGVARALAVAAGALPVGTAVTGARRSPRAGAAARWALAALAAIALVAGAAGFGSRMAEVPGDVRTAERQGRLQGEVAELADRLGPEALFACGRLRMTSLLAQTSLAWHLERPIGAIVVRRRPAYGTVLAFRPLPGGRVLGREGRWWATRLPCGPGGRRR